MQESREATPSSEKRKVRFADISAGEFAGFCNGIERIYNNEFDVIVCRNVFPRVRLAALGEFVDGDTSQLAWSRPNAVSPADDIYVLGTDTPATPTFKAPRGASLETYLGSAAKYEGAADTLFSNDFQPLAEIERALGLFSGGRRVEFPVAADGRRYVPYTVRKLAEGRRIAIHHDYHYPLALYQDLAPRLDTTTLVSFFTVLQRPDSGGELVVYALTSDNPDQPKLPNGMWDAGAIGTGFHHVAFVVDVGDLLLLASGRCFHRVEQVVGPRSRVTLGGFLAFDKGRTRVLYWS